jgi:hypothetical protein
MLAPDQTEIQLPCAFQLHVAHGDRGRGRRDQQLRPAPGATAVLPATGTAMVQQLLN